MAEQVDWRLTCSNKRGHYHVKEIIIALAHLLPIFATLIAFLMYQLLLGHLGSRS